MKSITLIVHDIFRDGGTMICYEKENPTAPYYIDKRVNTNTPLALYDDYPGNNNAKIIEIEYRIYKPYV